MNLNNNVHIQKQKDTATNHKSNWNKNMQIYKDTSLFFKKAVHSSKWFPMVFFPPEITA